MKLREFERIEESRRIGLETHGTSGGREWNKPEEVLEEGTFWKKGHQISINKACTYLRKKRTPLGSCP